MELSLQKPRQHVIQLQVLQAGHARLGVARAGAPVEVLLAVHQARHVREVQQRQALQRGVVRKQPALLQAHVGAACCAVLVALAQAVQQRLVSLCADVYHLARALVSACLAHTLVHSLTARCCKIRTAGAAWSLASLSSWKAKGPDDSSCACSTCSWRAATQRVFSVGLQRSQACRCQCYRLARHLCAGAVEPGDAEDALAQHDRHVSLRGVLLVRSLLRHSVQQAPRAAALRSWCAGLAAWEECCCSAKD